MTPDNNTRKHANAQKCDDTQKACAKYNNNPDCLIEILHLIQTKKGHISENTIHSLAHCLNRTRAEILGVISFYHDFHTTPPPDTIIHICRAEACQARGCKELIDSAETRFSTRIDSQPNANGMALRSAFCLGNCARGPAVMVEKKLYGDVSIGRLESLLATQS